MLATITETILACIFLPFARSRCWHYSGVVMSVMASKITSLTIVYSIVYSGIDDRKHQSSASLAIVREIHRWPVHSQHKGPVTWKLFLSDDVIMSSHKTLPNQTVGESSWNTHTSCFITKMPACFPQDQQQQNHTGHQSWLMNDNKSQCCFIQV